MSRQQLAVRAGEERTLQSEFPGAVRWGVAGPIGGSWAEADACHCPGCNDNRVLVVWGIGGVIHQECFRCWFNETRQLSLLDRGEQG
ncbi:hypothetical protein [Leptolyngbya sp. BC1307]|uniref:hypothetical protein n=1 Tax=Leptolyngbya sp. BC1307 TaxID=2029589 RepID=UPI000EFACD89|nr:hypothetical protein [Leptolyngbya sp. BC1307]